MAGKPVYPASEAERPPAYMQSQKSFTCKFCGEKFDSMPRLAAHISHYHSKRRRKSREERIIELLEQLLAEVKALRQDLRSLKLSAVEVKEERRIIRKAEVEASKKPVDKKLPSFMQDNPWIDILSRRPESD